MLFKIFFLGVIIFASMGIGNVIVEEKAERIRLLGCLQKGGRAMQGAMVLEGLPLIEGLRAAERVSGMALFSLMAECIGRDPGLSGREIVAAAIAVQKKEPLILKAPEIEILGDFVARASSAISAEQITDAAQMFARQMNAMVTDLNREHAKKEKTIRALCLCMGLAAAVILA